MRTIRNAPVKNKIPVSVELAGVDDGAIWDREIRPVELHHHPGRTSFRWRRSIRYLPLLKRLAFGPKAKTCYALSAQTSGHDEEAVLAGLVLLVEGAAFPPDKYKQCVYVWYLGSAPDAYMRSRGVELIPRAGEVLIDAAIQASITAGFEGRIYLHAARSGGQGLLDYYRGVGLSPLCCGVPIPQVRSRNDGRYFVADEQTARYIVRRNERNR
ncbi:hypothetical protein [Trinickia dinghuensis]|uniref:hypothetical protein n=1 Tax=Trinickia dinghuensis TaxID=2291023 RepID=UPI000E1F453B|nr:hypothetical protein [Trinickia dinghuensis]